MGKTSKSSAAAHRRGGGAEGASLFEQRFTRGKFSVLGRKVKVRPRAGANNTNDALRNVHRSEMALRRPPCPPPVEGGRRRHGAGMLFFPRSRRLQCV